MSDTRDYHGQPLRKGDVVRRVRDAQGVRRLRHRKLTHCEAIIDIAEGQIKTELSDVWESPIDFEKV